jgi:hypothetical protein
MAIVLLAIIGVKINAGVGYWVCFGLYCLNVFSKPIIRQIIEKGHIKPFS